MSNFVVRFLLDLVLYAIQEFVCRGLTYGVVYLWHLVSPSRRQRREERVGLRLIYDGSYRLKDVAILRGAYADGRLSELPIEIVKSLQRTWPHILGRAAIGRWLDLNAPGWRRLPRKGRIAAAN
ncbi:MAG: hypothetical protein HY246_09740 [Proteobacteria bacterium]|nr:hypothetical protein [Pseudomonadota bacterium]